MAEKDGALYVSAVEGHHVIRYGSQVPIGHAIDLSHPGNIRWDEEAITAIPWTEYLTYKAEYDRLLADGALVQRSKTDYALFQKERDEAIEAAAKKAEADRKVGAARGAQDEAAEETADEER